MTNAKAPVSDNRDIDQDQFLTILSREDALARFEAGRRGSAKTDALTLSNSRRRVNGDHFPER